MRGHASGLYSGYDSRGPTSTPFNLAHRQKNTLMEATWEIVQRYRFRDCHHIRDSSSPLDLDLPLREGCTCHIWVWEIERVTK